MMNNKQQKIDVRISDVIVSIPPAAVGTVIDLILTLETVELKLEVGLDSVTKSVVAMCLSNLANNIQIGHQM
ncbi:unnamed protein product [Rotaria sp. Silwood1]|nr:unnamed protein product [Rotaria sp. Silwood1]CAF4847008.1 unnamed protein product [Rotaria sp. Silwood1]CAF4858935.1 unnamed protein product [Rotaria sp. Silwood1]